MICPARCLIDEGLLPERSVGVKEARGTKTTPVITHLVTADQDRQGQVILTADGTNHAQ